MQAAADWAPERQFTTMGRPLSFARAPIWFLNPFMGTLTALMICPFAKSAAGRTSITAASRWFMRSVAAKGSTLPRSPTTMLWINRPEMAARATNRYQWFPTNSMS